MPRKNYSQKPNKPGKYIQSGGNCDHKKRYSSEKEALEIKDHQELLTMGLELKVYKCTIPGCGGWHLTRDTSQKV